MYYFLRLNYRGTIYRTLYTLRISFKNRFHSIDHSTTSQLIAFAYRKKTVSQTDVTLKLLKELVL